MDAKLNKLFLIGSLMFHMSFSYGEEAGAWTTVKRIFTPADSAQPFIEFGADSMPGCYGNNAAYLPVSNVAGANRVYSTILAAFMAQKEVRIYYIFNDVVPGYTGWGLCGITNIYTR